MTANRLNRYRIVILSLGLSFLSLGCNGSGVKIFNGHDLTGWEGHGAERWGNTWTAADEVSVNTQDPTRLVIHPGDGILVNGEAGKTCDLISERVHGDCQLHVEFMVPKGSNSGVYLMGEYEIQVFDSFGKDEVAYSDCGGIYSRWIDEQNVEGHAPMVNASRPPGEWQTFEITFKTPRFDADGNKIANARFVKVVHNGQVVHDDVELFGPTRACLTGIEKAEGPLKLQGDHGPVAYRNLRLRAIDLD